MEQNYQIPYLPPARALTCLSMIYYMVMGQKVSERELMQENKTLEGIPDIEHSYYQIQQDSGENRRFSYRNEKEWLAQIENGTLQKRQVRLEAAANMLRFSEEQIGAIAEYLCFPSQSYFTERFRKQYGMTPGEYRKENQIIDFHGTTI